MAQPKPLTQHPPESGSSLAHMPAIDALRGLAILMVLFHHFTPAVSGTWFTKALLTATHTGWIGVDLFFVLSGFLITAILVKTRSSEDYFLNFFARRTLRIFPIYYLTLAVLLIGLPAMLQTPILQNLVQHWFGKVTRDLPAMLDGQSWLWLYGANVKIAVDGERWGAVNHFWSLAVEEHFYLIWPLIVYFVPTRAALARVCLVCIFAAPILRVMLMMAGFDSVVPYVLTPCRVDSLAIGALLAVLVGQPEGVKLWSRRLGWLAGLSMVGLVAIVVCYRRFDRDDLATTFVGYTMLAVVSAWLVLAAAKIKPGSRACRVIANPVLCSLGKYSYGIYVTHMFFAGAFARMFSWTTLRGVTGSYWSAIVLHAVLSVACSWGVAWIAYHVFEKHFLGLKRFFVYRRRVEAPARRPAIATAPLPMRPAQLQPVRRAA